MVIASSQTFGRQHLIPTNLIIIITQTAVIALLFLNKYLLQLLQQIDNGILIIRKNKDARNFLFCSFNLFILLLTLLLLTLNYVGRKDL